MVSARQLLLTFIASAGGVLHDTEFDEFTSLIIVWSETGTALVVILHQLDGDCGKYKPYSHAYQNHLHGKRFARLQRIDHRLWPWLARAAQVEVLEEDEQRGVPAPRCQRREVTSQWWGE